MAHQPPFTSKQEPVLLSAGWDSSREGSTVARHEWKGLNKLRSLEDWNERASQERRETTRRRRSARIQARGSDRMPGTYLGDEGDDLF